MSITNQILVKCSATAAICLTVFVAGNQPQAAALSLASEPLFLNSSAPPMNLLVLGRDHKLYYEAYNDHSDLNDDGVLDVGYLGWVKKDPAPEADSGESPFEIDYFGYFDSFKCYSYDSGTGRFNPDSKTADKKCSSQWSGDFLNYLTTSRIDALRKVLYGGFRSTDNADGTYGQTVLERSHIPQDAHSWGKEYTSVAVDKYDIKDYTPLTVPTSGRHLFANTTLLKSGSNEPRLRVAQNQPYRIWEWVSIERPVAGDKAQNGGSGPTISGIADYFVRVRVCRNSVGLESNCQAYKNGAQTVYKPVGLLQQYGENDSMYFGLLTGSYSKNTSGGVLRRTMGSITDEIDPATGIFRKGMMVNGTLTADKGIITTLNRLRSTGFPSDKNYEYTCGWGAASRTINEGECQMWGNPIAEMMYEGLRYFAGLGSATSAFSAAYGAGEESTLSGGGLPVATWDDPFTKRASCSKPFELVISDINPSYDTDQLPGSSFATFTGDDLGGLNVATLGQTIWDDEFKKTEKTIFIGQSGADSNGAPTPKKATSFGNIRGLSPEEPTKMGGYYSASVAYHGRTVKDINKNKAGNQNVATFAVALASPLPKIEIPVKGKKITLVPFAKSVNGSGISATATFQPTDQIVDFYVDSLTETSGKFRVNFEDVEQGADHDMDAIVVYEYKVNADDTVTINLTSEYAYGGITQHMGYVISGTTADGIYLDVRDRTDGEGGADVDYYLDTPAAFTATPPAPATGAGTWKDGVALPFSSTRKFSPGTTEGAMILPDPLWYAAKWGGFKDGNENGKPDVETEWDADKDKTPDNYFLVTNALTLGQQLSTAFNEILRRVASSSSATVNSGSVSSSSRVFQATFNSGDWTGHLLSYKIDEKNGALIDKEKDIDGIQSDWDAADSVPETRKIFTMATAGATAFTWDALKNDTTYKAKLGSDDATREAILDYISGSDELETTKPGGTFRARVGKLGDIVNSSPMFVGKPSFFYPDNFAAKPYSEFRSKDPARKNVIYVGANDGMLHAFDVADTAKGEELFAYIPSPVVSKLKNLASPTYKHEFFVDGPPNMGDAYINSAWRTVLVGGLNAGGQGIYALDISNPSTFSKDNVLWEFTDRNANGDADLGYTFSQPAIVRLGDTSKRWAAIFGNGYNSSEADGAKGDGIAKLFIVDLSNGSKIAEISTGVGDDGSPNGLGTPAVVDLNGDQVADYVYAGDLRGNLWKFDISSTNTADWKVAYKDASSNPLPLYVAKDAADPANVQPITSRPEVTRGANGAGMMVLFGTGKFLESIDKIVDPDKLRTQTFYGIYDPNSKTSSDVLTGRASLAQQTIDAEGTVGTSKYRITSNKKAGARGWYMDLPASTGERVVSNPIFRNDRVIFTTMAPQADPCSFGGTSWLMELEALTGARLPSSPFDVNRDGKIDEKDIVNIKDGDGKDVPYYPSGTQSEVGIIPEPGILTDRGRAVEYKYTAGSSGEVQVTTESTPDRDRGRQSWRPLR